MSVFSKLFGRKKEEEGRVSSIERFERRVARPIEFMTEHGGGCPLEYDMDTEKMAVMKEESLNYLQKAIAAGCIDEYSDLSIFYDMVKKRSVIVENELKNQNVIRKAAGGNIKIVAKEALCQLEKKESQLKAERKRLAGIEECRENSDYEKGLGDLHE